MAAMDLIGTFPGAAIVHQAAGSPETHAFLKGLRSLIPAEWRATAANDLELKARVEEVLNRHPAVGVVRDGSRAFFYGHGMADIASDTPVTEDTVFRIGSVTKTFTAIAVMQLWEQGLLDLDAPANDHLRAYKLVPAKATHRPATVRHLLTYTAGLPQAVYLTRAFKPTLGEMVEFGQRCRRLPSSTVANSISWQSRAPCISTATTVSPRSVRSLRT
jgi:CubicO group peptidase (beta-lactamase class C family)